MTDRFTRTLAFGATILADGRVRFRLWAPGQTSVAVMIGNGPALSMHPEFGGWFTATAACPAGARYRYRLADGTLVPDPAARAQADDVHGQSLVVDPTTYRWRNPGWTGRPWRETVLYELHAGVMGGFAGVAGELPRLAALA